MDLCDETAVFVFAISGALILGFLAGYLFATPDCPACPECVCPVIEGVEFETAYGGAEASQFYETVYAVERNMDNVSGTNANTSLRLGWLEAVVCNTTADYGRGYPANGTNATVIVWDWLSRKDVLTGSYGVAVNFSVDNTTYADLGTDVMLSDDALASIENVGGGTTNGSSANVSNWASCKFFVQKQGLHD